MLPDAILWDMDGTIVDTEPYWMAAETPLVESFGGSWSHEQALQLVGNGLEESARLLQAAGVELSELEIIDALTDRVTAALTHEGVPFRPGARELLAAASAHPLPQALVTMSLRRMAVQIASLIEGEPFAVVVAGDDAERPKPHPEPYLQAARALGVAPGRTVAIEDSVTGVRSARAAGCVVIGVPHLVPLEGAGAHELVPSLAGLGLEGIARIFTVHAAAAATTTQEAR